MDALRLAYAARPAPALLPVGRWVRRAWSLYFAALKEHLADRYGVPRRPFLH